VPGDVALGLASSGVHSNGFSLVRRLVELAHLDYADPAPFAPGKSLGEALLTPTRIYVKSLLPLLKVPHDYFFTQALFSFFFPSCALKPIGGWQDQSACPHNWRWPS